MGLDAIPRLVSTKDDSSPKQEVHNMRRGVSAVLVSAVLSFSVATALPQAALEATIEVETRARVVLQSKISSKLNEPGDPIPRDPGRAALRE